MFFSQFIAALLVTPLEGAFGLSIGIWATPETSSTPHLSAILSALSTVGRFPESSAAALWTTFKTDWPLPSSTGSASKDLALKKLRKSPCPFCAGPVHLFFKFPRAVLSTLLRFCPFSGSLVCSTFTRNRLSFCWVPANSGRNRVQSGGHRGADRQVLFSTAWTGQWSEPNTSGMIWASVSSNNARARSARM